MMHVAVPALLPVVETLCQIILNITVLILDVLRHVAVLRGKSKKVIDAWNHLNVDASGKMVSIIR